MPELHVTNLITDEDIGTIDADNLGEILDALEDADIIDDSDEFSVQFGTGGCYYVLENGTRKFILSPIEDDEEDEDFDDDDDDDDDDEDDDD
jgi:hypothetical protein